MAKALVIVESPAKAKTINKYLGKQYVVKASLGHVKDLPKKDLAVDVDNDFEPHYEVIEGKKKLIAELKAAAKKVDAIYLAADPDREGEAICFHLQEELHGKKKGGAQDLPGDVQRDHQERHPEGVREAAAGEREPGGRAAGAPRARPAGGLQDLAAAVGQGAARPLRRPRADRRAAADRRARARDPRVRQKQEYWTIDVDLRRQEAAGAHGAPGQDQRRERRRSATRQPPTRSSAQLDGADYVGQVRRHAREEAQPGRAVHHLHAAAGIRRASCASA